MIHCNRCDYDNEDTGAFCVRCGSQLDSGLYEFVSSAPFPSPAQESTTDQPEYTSFQLPYAQETFRPNPQGKKVLNIVIAATVFCIGDFIASFGLIGGLLAVMNDSLAVLLGFCLLFASFIVCAIVITQHNVFFLRWWLKILLPFAATGILFIALIAVSILFESNHILLSAMYGASVLVFGIIIEVIALC